MNISRASFQSHESLDRFYGDMAASGEPGSVAIGRQMLELLSALPRVNPQARLWAFTSLTRLWLIDEDDPSAVLLLGIQALPTGGYRFYRAVGRSYVAAEAIHTAEDLSSACSFVFAAELTVSPPDGAAG
jgi:hypothetical protein